MKKFFKALALVLALTLIVGVVPAQTADAATKVPESKTLYVGGAQGKSADGKIVSKISNKVAIYKLAGLTKAEKEGKKVTAELAGKDDGSIKITKNYVVAKALGSAKVDILVDGQKVGTTTIYSKVNASKDTLVLVDGEGKEIKDGQTFVVGGKYTFKLPRAGKDSDERRLFINDKAAEETAKGSRVYEYKFLKSEEGEVTFKFEAFQYNKDNKLDGAIVSKVIKGKVVPPTATAIKQTKSDSFAITFDSNIEEGGYYADVKQWEAEVGIANDVYYKISDVQVPFSSVKATTPKENVLNVQMYGAFDPNETYYVNIAGTTLSFKAAGNGAKDVTDVVVVTTTATVEENVDIEYKLLNSLGVDITSTAAKDGTVTFEGTPSSASDYLDPLGTVYFAKVGDSVKVKATFTFYDPDNNYEAKTTVGEGAIVGVAAATPKFVSAEYGIEKVGKTSVMLEDPAKALVIKAKIQIGSDTKTVGLGDTIFGTPLQAKISDEHYAMVTEDDKVVAVNYGNTSILLYYVTESGKEVTLAALPLKVDKKRVATSISASVKNVNTGSIYLNSGLDADALELTVTVKDQYGDEFSKDGNVTIEMRTGVKNTYNAEAKLFASAVSAGTDTKFQVNTPAEFNADQLWASGTASGAAVTKEDTLSYVVKAEGLTTNVSFKIQYFAANSGTTLVAYTSASTMDVALTTSASNTNCDDVTMHVNQMKGNYWTGHEDLFLTDTAFSTKNTYDKYPEMVANGVTSAAVAVITRNGAKLDIETSGNPATKVKACADMDAKFAVDGEGYSKISDLISCDGKIVTFDTYNDVAKDKLPAGNYVVSFYKVNDTKGTTLIGNKTLTITDSQVIPVANQDEQKVSITTLPDGTPTDSYAIKAVQDAYTFKWNGKALDDACVTAVNYKTSADGKIYVYSVVVTVSKSLAGSATAVLYENKYASGAVDGYKFIVPIGELLN